MTDEQQVPKVRPSTRLQISEADLEPSPPGQPIRPNPFPGPAPVPTAKPAPAALPALNTTAAPAAPMPYQSAQFLAAQMNSKSPGTAVVLSLLWTGAGQCYCGRIGRGIAFMAAALVSFALLFVVIGILLLPLVWVWAAVDANQLAKQHNARLIAQVTGVASGV